MLQKLLAFEQGQINRVPFSSAIYLTFILKTATILNISIEQKRF